EPEDRGLRAVGIVVLCHGRAGPGGRHGSFLGSTLPVDRHPEPGRSLRGARALFRGGSPLYARRPVRPAGHPQGRGPARPPPPGAGRLILLPADQPVPFASTINFRAGQSLPNNAIVPLATDGTGRIGVEPFIVGAGKTHLVLDVVGYFAPLPPVGFATSSPLR